MAFLLLAGRLLIRLLTWNIISTVTYGEMRRTHLQSKSPFLSHNARFLMAGVLGFAFRRLCQLLFHCRDVQRWDTVGVFLGRDDFRDKPFFSFFFFYFPSIFSIFATGNMLNYTELDFFLFYPAHGLTYTQFVRLCWLPVAFQWWIHAEPREPLAGERHFSVRKKKGVSFSVWISDSG